MVAHMLGLRTRSPLATNMDGPACGVIGQPRQLGTSEWMKVCVEQVSTRAVGWAPPIIA